MHAPIVSKTSSAYRADIDGLRAVAVLAVVVFHAFPDEKWLTGGFIGVDVFFVISGFLISKLILAELGQHQFSVVEFYRRRIRRIFPALAVVLLAVLAYGFLVLMPSELALLGKHAFFGASFLSNFAFWSESGYFDSAAISKPLLHLWSLGVEEQFYILWPPILMLAFRSKVRVGWLISVLFVGSFAVNVALSLTDLSGDFYLPITRFWELLAGAALAWHGEITIHRNLRHLLSLAGCGAILTSAILFTPEMSFPGWIALLPVAGAVAVIAAGPAAAANRVILSNRAAVSIGLISYPLYLWHWPLISFSYIIRDKLPTSLMALGLVIASALLAWATYCLIERPVRFGSSRAMLTKFAAVGVAAVGVCGLVIWISGGLPQRFSSSLDLKKINDAISDETYAPTSGMKVLEFNTDRRYAMVSQIGHGNRTVVFAGNSAILHFGPRVQRLADEGSLSSTVFFVTGPGCQVVPSLVDPNEFVKCSNVVKSLSDLIKRERADSVVLGVSYIPNKDSFITRDGKPVPLDGKNGQRAFYDSLEAYVRELQQTSTVYLLRGIPNSKARLDPKHMVERRITGLRIDPNIERPISIDELRSVHAINDGELRAIADRTRAKLLDAFPDVCGMGHTCSPFFGEGEPKFADGAHLRPRFVSNHVLLFDFLLTDR
ncbi:acyltransferase [Bradyrhizobium lablabi]|uniref:acyltransferase family protein n=1 Tax=Bradyrhizobium lablabi TaxID=722472 RepID=UPI001BABDAA6|nr:acyltransferase [Bradyrhizobium lablabi]MBR1124545.1 acyltransferase [Bradyrhizobium lablabi]